MRCTLDLRGWDGNYRTKDGPVCQTLKKNWQIRLVFLPNPVIYTVVGLWYYVVTRNITCFDCFCLSEANEDMVDKLLGRNNKEENPLLAEARIFLRKTRRIGYESEGTL